MPAVLPKGPVAPTRISPKLLILYSMHKVGKTDELTKLPSNLICYTEEGAESYECLRMPINTAKDAYEIRGLIEQAGQQNAKEGKTGNDLFPYQFISLDTIDELETIAERSATKKYREGPLNSKGDFEQKGYTTITELPKGGGYFYLRNEVQLLIDQLAAVCPRMILTAHVRDKEITEKDGTVTVYSDLSLSGKLGAILCAKADAIGYMYRSSQKENNGQLMISFETLDKKVMGARQKYLAGQKFPFSWDRIYPDVLELVDGVYQFKK